MNTSAPDPSPSKGKNSCPERVELGTGGSPVFPPGRWPLWHRLAPFQWLGWFVPHSGYREYTQAIQKAMPQKYSSHLSGCCLDVFFITGGSCDAVPKNTVSGDLGPKPRFVHFQRGD